MVVKQAANVIDLLEYFARRRGPATLTEISDDLGWPRSSTFNIIETLIARGYVYTPVARFGYYLTPKWLLSAESVADATPIPDIVHQFIEDLAADTGETVSLAAPAGLQVVLVHVVESKAVIRYSAEVGKLLPIHSSAAGRAVLSQYPAGVRNSVLSKVTFHQYQPNSMMSREAVLAEMKRSEERGWFQANTEFTPDVSGLAVALPMMGRKMAVAIGGPSFRMQPRIHELGTAAKARAEGLIAQLAAHWTTSEPPVQD